MDGSGRAIMSASTECSIAHSIADPSKVMPSSKATSSSAGLIDTDLRNPCTSVNHNLTKRIPRSSTVRSTSHLFVECSVTPCGLQRQR